MGLDLLDAALVFGIFTLAGLIKGIAGFGLPTVSLGLLALTRPLPEAIPLVLLPTLATNIWQAFGSGALGPTLRRFGGFLLAAAVCTFAAAGQLARADAALLAGFLGLLLAASSLLALLGPRWPMPPPRAERWLSPVMGGASGAVAGLTGSFMVPAAPWLAALRLSPDMFVQAFALGAVVATLVLAVSMAGQGLLPPELGLASVAVMAPAFLGMAVGRRVRGALSEAAFRRVVQVCLLVLGLYLVARNLA
ncbi:sulfite exporter TauE/SafE family protein [Crenalkalicoccus roseus]|uniref:sulfite exporter TauE/SafE family protein n=1 Tax=Crenalkalicoccus roseus TaxID=1485588 RepID=UPI0010816E7B|nr:sulfite exporter TauE/SafE family protein [Crenalkalicoccus roseus]